MSVTEYRRWQAYDRISPLGGERLDILFGLLISALLNVFRSSASTREVRVRDVLSMLSWYEPSEDNSDPSAAFEALLAHLPAEDD